MPGSLRGLGGDDGEGKDFELGEHLWKFTDFTEYLTDETIGARERRIVAVPHRRRSNRPGRRTEVFDSQIDTMRVMMGRYLMSLLPVSQTTSDALQSFGPTFKTPLQDGTTGDAALDLVHLSARFVDAERTNDDQVMERKVAPGAGIFLTMYCTRRRC